MPPLYTSTYHYDDHTLTVPAPGRALIEEIDLVESLPGIGPKGGGRYIGTVVAIGPKHTRIHRPYDGIEMTLPNADIKPWTAPFETAAFAAGCYGPLAELPGWHWLRWTVAEHLAHDLTVGAANDAGIASGTETSNTKSLVVVPCGSTKAAVPSPAGQLYLSTYHRLGLRAAAALTGPDSIRILSARHGLLPLHREIAPYDLRLGQPGAVTATTLRQQAGEQGLLDHPDVVLFGGRAYVELARQVWPHARTPLAGTKGIGEQQQRLAGIVSAGHLN
ncbi:DUF6884 domain-containing protein [Rhodococcus sp. C3V]|uniref:DUF6884 domain-containing protein n=1 Tax=Rhodococcus sp. C3V TaxID=3034165 RepID=UPI0023E19444|nr:DUF6884 domain-containing protein [Rhodococcus sp. C3V]MDF3319852.1 hypothetical protein [Rhodococcus sp. C3V]